MQQRPEQPSAPNGLAAVAPSGSLLERITDAFIALDAGWRFVYVNARAAQIIGRGREELIGKHLWTEMPEGVGKAFYNAYHQALAEQTPRHIEEYSTTRGRWFENHIYPSPDGLSLFFRDVTERHETQGRLEESEQRYRSLYEQNPDAVYTFDLDGRFVDANHACEVVSGYPIEELHQTSFLALVVPEDQARTLALFQRAKGGMPGQEEIAIRHKTGRRVALSITKVPIQVGGKVTGVFGIAKDISERKIMEEALRGSEDLFRTLAETTPVAMTITRWEDGAVLYANGHVRTLFGVAPGEDLTRRRAAEFYVHPADRERLKRALSEENYAQNYETLFQRTDRTMFWGSGAYQRMDFAGEPALFAAFYDITERKRLLEQAQEEAERDPLTDLRNHRSFHRRFEEEARRAGRRLVAGGRPAGPGQLQVLQRLLRPHDRR